MASLLALCQLLRGAAGRNHHRLFVLAVRTQVADGLLIYSKAYGQRDIALAMTPRVVKARQGVCLPRLQTFRLGQCLACKPGQHLNVLMNQAIKDLALWDATRKEKSPA